MNDSKYNTAIAEFIRTKGITRCPTRFAVPSQAAAPPPPPPPKKVRAKRTKPVSDRMNKFLLATLEIMQTIAAEKGTPTLRDVGRETMAAALNARNYLYPAMAKKQGSGVSSPWTSEKVSATWGSLVQRDLATPERVGLPKHPPRGKELG